MSDASGLETYTAWCRDELFTPPVVQATKLLNEYCDLRLQGVYRDLGLASVLTTPHTGAQVATALGFVDSADVTMWAMLARLAARTDTVNAEGERGTATFTHRNEPADPWARLAAIRTEMEVIGADYGAALEFLDFGAAHFSEALKDDPDLMDKMLAGRDAKFQELWHRATNLDPLQDLHGKMGARAIMQVFGGGTILELGGGTGNGIRHLFRDMKADGSLSKLDKFIFTDISNRFIMTTRKEIKTNYPDDFGRTDWKFFDLNDPFVDQKIPMGEIDLVYAVNAAHVAKDMVGMLRQCKDALRPGGRVLFAERIRVNPYEMAPRELTLNLSVYHRSAAERADYRPMHCYLAPENWVTIMELAGLRPEIWPDLDAMGTEFPDQYAAIVMGIKPEG